MIVVAKYQKWWTEQLPTLTFFFGWQEFWVNVKCVYRVVLKKLFSLTKATRQILHSRSHNDSSQFSKYYICTSDKARLLTCIHVMYQPFMKLFFFPKKDFWKSAEVVLRSWWTNHPFFNWSELWNCRQQNYLVWSKMRNVNTLTTCLKRSVQSWRTCSLDQVSLFIYLSSCILRK